MYFTDDELLIIFQALTYATPVMVKVNEIPRTEILHLSRRFADRLAGKGPVVYGATYAKACFADLAEGDL